MNNKVHVLETAIAPLYRIGDMFMIYDGEEGNIPHVVMLVCASYDISQKRNHITLICLESGNRWGLGNWVPSKQETFSSSEMTQLVGRVYSFKQVFNVEIKRGE